MKLYELMDKDVLMNVAGVRAVVEKKRLKKRSRGRCIFPAESSNVTDGADHYPINNIDQARNALARVAQHKGSPSWYKGSLTKLQNTVRRAVKKAYPSINVTKPVDHGRKKLAASVNSGG